MPETDGTEKDQPCRCCATPTLLLRSFTMFTRFSLFFASAVLFLIYLDIQRTRGNNVIEAVPYVGEQSTSIKCLQPTVDLSKMLQNAPVVLAGRFRQRFGKTNAKLTNDRFSLPDQRFNATVLVTNVYKSFDHEQDQIMVGSFFTPTVDSHDGPGCLDAFYRNSKYIFFLRRNMNADNFYDVTYSPHPYTEELDRNIQAKQCVNCFAPKIQPLDDLLLKPGSKLTVTCSASGRPSPELVWVKNGKSLNLVDKSVSIEMIKVSEDNVESVLEISNLIRIDSGEYKCLATNPLGKASELFNLQITQPEKSGQLLMDTELVSCSDEDRDYCLNGGQCYMLKSDRNVLQCRCPHQYFGDRCHFHIGGLLAYAEVADPDMEHMLKHVLSEVITPLMWSVWIGFPVTILLLVYLIAKGRGDQCQKNVQKKRNREPRTKDRNSFAPLVPGQSHTQNNLSETDISLAHGGFGNHHLDVPHNNRRYCLSKSP
ncbi:hypothetical protein PHET_03792 [Paragonimus heterotremus]|uniref:Ig-like domain-containing protein n=1 Tax=Paragonimus heterotremus TaxID=100268 RepID=A0A8J4T9X0_9TREM|nr:hypothetical protein PHET_03792 [Paragonimus heterotremus]